MGSRLEGKRAIVIGAGQTPGITVGNGRAISILFAREGAKVMLVDRRVDSARETKAIIDKEGGESFAFEADITQPDDCRKIAETCVETYGGIDVLVREVWEPDGIRPMQRYFSPRMRQNSLLPLSCLSMGGSAVK